VGSLLGVSRHVERSWRTMRSSRSQKGHVRWEVCLAIKRRYPLQRPKLSLPYTRLKQYACGASSSEERSAGNPHATFCGSRR